MRLGSAIAAMFVSAAVSFGATEASAAADEDRSGFLEGTVGSASMFDLTYGSFSERRDGRSDAPEISSPNSLFLSGLEGIGATLLRSDSFRIGVRTRGAVRDDPDDGQSLITSDDRLDVGAFGAFMFDDWTLSASLDQGLSGGTGGFAGDIGVKWATRFAEDWVVELGPEFSWASEDYLSGLENFTPRQRAPGRGLQLYDPTPGARELSVSGSVHYSISDSWTVGGMVGAQRMMGDSAERQAVEDENEFFGGVSLGVRF